MSLSYSKQKTSIIRMNTTLPFSYRRFHFTFQDPVAKFVPKVPNYVSKFGSWAVTSQRTSELRNELPNFETNFRTSKRTFEVQSTHGVRYVMACGELTDFLGNIEQKIGKESYEIITNILRELYISALIKAARSRKFRRYICQK